MCGGLYYAYNEMGFRVLDLLSPVSQAIANSAKRVVILAAAVVGTQQLPPPCLRPHPDSLGLIQVFLGEPVSRRKLVGSAVAIAGVTLYSMAKVRSSLNLSPHAQGLTSVLPPFAPRPSRPRRPGVSSPRRWSRCALSRRPSPLAHGSPSTRGFGWREYRELTASTCAN